MLHNYYVVVTYRIIFSGTLIDLLKQRFSSSVTRSEGIELLMGVRVIGHQIRSLGNKWCLARNFGRLMTFIWIVLSFLWRVVLLLVQERYVSADVRI